MRRRFTEVLDAAEKGDEVLIERRGVRYVLRVESKRPRPRRQQSLITYMDPAVAAGQWTWDMEFVDTRRKK